MVQINFAQKQVNAKIVYYGPGMSGKTTNLEVIHQRAPDQNRGDLTSISTDGDRTLFFDFMPLDLGTVAGMRTCFQIYTVPGQVYYNSTRKLVLQGVDGVVFVADSSASMVEENLESMRNLEENLNEYGKSLGNMPMIIQYNKRDLPDAMSVEELDQLINQYNSPSFEAVANTGQGVFPTLKALAGCVLDQIHKSYGSQGGAAPQAENAPVSSGMTGFYQAPEGGAPAPSPVEAPSQAPGFQAPQQQPVQQQPIQQQPAPVQPAAQMPVEQHQTGFHPAHQPVQQGYGNDASQNFVDPMAKTNVHAPPTQQVQPDTGAQPTLRMAPSPGMGQPAMQQTVQQQAPMHDPGMHQRPQQNVMNQGTDPSAMQQQNGGARSFPVSSPPAQSQGSGPRLRPRAAARPTPNGGGGKSALFTGMFVVAALGMGAVLGRLVLSLF